MTRKLFATLMVVAMMMLTIGVAGATNGAHFFSVGSSVDDAGSLIISYDEAGVGNQTVDYTLNYHFVANWGCINGGGNHPKASNKETQSGDVTASFSEDPDNGRVSASFSTPVLDPPAGFACPSGQTLVLADVAYMHIVLNDTTNSVSTPVPNASRIYFRFR